MNDLQEVILDRLMGTDKIGVSWQPGPLKLAFEILRAQGLTKRTDPARALGFPAPLCAAIEGACQVLPTLEDVRSLSIALFSELQPQRRMPRLSERALVEIAYWSLRQAFEMYNQREPLCDVVVAELERYLATGSVAPDSIAAASHQLERTIVASAKPLIDFDPRQLTLSVFFFALHTGRQAAEGKWPEDNAAMTALYSGRLASLRGGFQGGARYCLDLAREMGM